MANLRIRKYKKGDEDLITPNELMSDWESDKYVNRWALENGETYTIINSNGDVQAIACLVSCGGDLLYGWFLRDINANSLFIIKIKEIVKKYLQNGFKICTISKEGPMQDRMHEYLGFEYKGKVEGGKLWVVQ